LNTELHASGACPSESASYMIQTRMLWGLRPASTELLINVRRSTQQFLKDQLNTL
jgi:hypothetical protein